MAGRKKGSKNLRKSGEAIINKNGVAFTEEEHKALVSAVNSANRKAKRMRKEEGELEYYIGGQATGYKRKDLPFFMGAEMDFALSKKSKSLQRFRNKIEYEKYMDNLRRVTARGYEKERAEGYRANHIQALDEVFGKAAEGVIKVLEDMNIKDYMKTVAMDESLTISYIDSDQDEQEFAATHGYTRNQQLERMKVGLDNIISKTPTPKSRKKRKK
jgi:hypothetical protein